MKVLLICMGLFACALQPVRGATQEEILPSYGYVKLGYIATGGGYRFRKDHWGVDLSATGIVQICALYTTANVQGLYYFNPQGKRAWYCGGGGGLGTGMLILSWNEDLSIFPEVHGVLGCEFRNCIRVKSFLQLDVTMPCVGSVCPWAALVFGWAF